MLIAVRADRREQALEGLYWLAVLKGKPFKATAAMVNSTNIIEEGWLVVKTQWLKLEKKNCEGKLHSYSLLDAETLIVVNHTVRLAGLKFAQAKGGPQGRTLRAEAVAKLIYISNDTHHSIEACCSEEQSK